MTKSKISARKRGFTLIELMLVVAIMSVLSSIITPRISLLLQKAHQSTAKGNLGIIRSTISLYYSDLEGLYPMHNSPDGFPDLSGTSLSAVLTPKYIGTLPYPKLMEKVGSFNGLPLFYDIESEFNLKASPVRDVLVLRGPAGATPGVNRPWVYDPTQGAIYLCNDNYDTSGGTHFYQW